MFTISENTKANDKVKELVTNFVSNNNIDESLANNYLNLQDLYAGKLVQVMMKACREFTPKYADELFRILLHIQNEFIEARQQLEGTENQEKLAKMAVEVNASATDYFNRMNTCLETGIPDEDMETFIETFYNENDGKYPTPHAIKMFGVKIKQQHGVTPDFSEQANNLFNDVITNVKNTTAEIGKNLDEQNQILQKTSELIQEKESAIGERDGEIESLKKDIEDLKQQRSQANKNGDTEAYETLNRKIESYQKILSDKDGEIEKMQGEIRQLTVKMNEASESGNSAEDVVKMLCDVLANGAVKTQSQPQNTKQESVVPTTVPNIPSLSAPIELPAHPQQVPEKKSLFSGLMKGFMKKTEKPTESVEHVTLSPIDALMKTMMQLEISPEGVSEVTAAIQAGVPIDKMQTFIQETAGMESSKFVAYVIFYKQSFLNQNGTKSQQDKPAITKVVYSKPVEVQKDETDDDDYGDSNMPNEGEPD